MTIALTPLSFGRAAYEINDGVDACVTAIAWRAEYGDRRYYTPDMFFCIFADADGWNVAALLRLGWHQPAVATAFDQSGLGDAIFEQRSEALEALEIFVQSADG